MAKKKGPGKSAIAPIKYTQFIEVRIKKKGSMTICEALTEDGVTENFIWSRKSHRQKVHENAAPNIKIAISSDVPSEHGWNWDYKY